MKGFPNQVAKLPKLAIGMRELVRLVDEGANAKDDGILGEAFLRAAVSGKRDKTISIDEYLRDQRTKTKSDQSFRASARFLRELYALLGFIDDSEAHMEVTDLGRRAAAYAGSPMDGKQVDFWRRVIANITHEGSHPYQVLLRLVGQKPGITRAKCALALEAQNDSAEELDRMVALSDLPEAQIRSQIGVTKSNWDNAKKVLPSFAEQLGDVIRSGDSFRLADAPGLGNGGVAPPGGHRVPRAPGVRTPRSSRAVTPDTIGKAGTADRSDEVEIPPEIDPAAAAKAIKLRLERLKRHNVIVQELARRLAGAQLYEDPFDIFALIEAFGLLIEVKTLDGSQADERDRVRDALSQLLYYEAFVTTPIAGEAAIHKIACFESPISEAHRNFLNEIDIAVIWKANGGFGGDELAANLLGDYLQELR